MLIRIIKENDLQAIYDIAGKVGFGFTSFPKDPKTIEAKVNRAIESFKQSIPREASFFLFVLEHPVLGSVIGTSAIEASVSHRTLSPFYNYEVANIIQKSTVINLEKHHQVLILENNYQDDSVLCALYLDADQRGLGQGEFLSRARCLFIAEFPDFFSHQLIAEMRGFYDEYGASPFWEGLGKNFFDRDLHSILHIVATEGTQIIGDLMPAYPIYNFLLPESARAVISLTHPKTMPARHVLEKEGFSYRNYIDVLDAGPLLEVKKSEIKTVKESRRLKIAGYKNNIEGDVLMLSNTSLDFRAVLGQVLVTDNEEVFIENEAAELLKVEIGDYIRFSKFR